MLKYAKTKLDSFTDNQNDILDVMEAGVQSEVSQISHRHVIANHKYLNNYNSDKKINIYGIFRYKIICMAMV